jgi:hypothetical protein
MKHRIRNLAAVLMAVQAGISSAQSIYTGASGGNWNVAGNWSLGVPTSMTDARVNNNSSNVTVLVNVASNVAALTIDAGDAVSINNVQRLGLFGTLTNNGTLRVDATTGNTYLMPSGTVTLNGTGTIELADTSASVNGWFYDVNNVNGAADHIINSATHTIRGRGTVGTGSSTQITNNGLIHADVGASPLELIPNASGLINTGTLRASNGGNLILNGSSARHTFTNTGAVIEALAGSTITLDSSPKIIGGTITGAGEAVSPNAAPGVYDGVTHNISQTRIVNGARLELIGTITNNSRILVDAIGSSTYVMPSGTVTLNGTGEVVLADTAATVNGWFYDVNNVNGTADHIINSATHTIRGRGTIGFSSTTQITNNGLIHADVGASPLELIPNASGLINTGTLRASNGGNLILNGSSARHTFTNTGAVIEALAGSTITLDSSPKIIGGTITGAGEAVSPNAAPGVYDGVTHNISQTRIVNGARLELIGTITNNSRILVDAISSNTYVMPSGTVTLNGTGEVVLADTAATVNAWFYDVNNVNGAADHIINSATHTIRGRGTIGFSSTTQITNNGLIHADQLSSPLVLLPNAGGMVNTGTLRASNGGVLQLSEGDTTAVYSGNGPLVSDAGSVIEVTAGVAGTLGQVTGAGRLRATGSGVLLTFSNFSVGTIEATSAGVLRLTPGGGNAGTSVVRDAIVLSGNGRIDLADHGLIFDYTGASPASTLRAQIAAGRAAGAWNGNNGIGSSLANNNGKAIGYAEATDMGSPATFLGVGIDSTAVLIRYTINGDATLDGSVSFDDLLRVAQNYDAVVSGKVWSNGDFTYDGLVNFDDLLALAQQYNQTLLTSGETESLVDLAGAGFVSDWVLARGLVPEPASLSLLAIGLAVGRRRR